MLFKKDYKLIKINKDLFIRTKKFKTKHLQLKIFKYITNSIGLFLLFIARKYYIKSLLGCDGDEGKCILNNNLKYILSDIYYCSHSIFYFLFFLFLVQAQLCSKYQLIIFLLIIFELIYKDHGDNFLHHGILNLSSLFILLILGEIIILIFILILYFIKKKQYLKLFVFSFLIILISFLFFIKHIENYHCKDWSRGLNGTYINNDESLYSCSIDIPKNKCLIDIISPFLDLSKLLGKSCEKREEKEKYLLKEISYFKNKKGIKKIGYPISIGEKDEIKGKAAPYSSTLLAFMKKNLFKIILVMFIY